MPIVVCKRLGHDDLTLRFGVKQNVTHSGENPNSQAYAAPPQERLPKDLALLPLRHVSSSKMWGDYHQQCTQDLIRGIPPNAQPHCACSTKVCRVWGNMRLSPPPVIVFRQSSSVLIT